MEKSVKGMTMPKRTASSAIRILTALFFILAITPGIFAQEQKEKKPRRHFSPEEFQAKQKEYIKEKAGLTQEEADAFFPLFFEKQKKKFEIERNAHKDINKKRHEKMTEEQCRKLVNNMADAKIEVAKLEKEYTQKFLEVLPACKILRVQRAEMSFQRDLMKKMMRKQSTKDKNEKKQ